MPFTMTMPKLSPTMEKGVVVAWHKKEGEFVEAGELLVEISTDKATVEHSPLDSGWLRQLLVAQGEEAAVNQPMAIFTESQTESIEGYVPQPAGALAGKVAASESAGGGVGNASLGAPPLEASHKPSQGQIQEALPAVVDPKRRILASPLAKKLAKEQGLDLAGLLGSGPGGRIMKRDLVHAKSAKRSGFASSNALEAALPPAGSYEEIPLSPVRQVIAARLQAAKATIPHFYVQQTIDAQGLISLRDQLKSQDVNLTFNDMVLKGCALALRKHPQVNCGFNSTKGVIISFKTIDISVAVSIDGGLITPIVTYADQKSILALSGEVKELVKKAKAGKLLPQEYMGGSFTISNLGMYGVSDFQAIINPPQAAILAVSAISEQAVVKNGAIVAGNLMHLSLSVDHRVIDGALAAEFLRTLKQILEAPAILLL